MKNAVSIIVASIVYVISTYVCILAIIVASRPAQFSVVEFLTSPAALQCSLITVISFSVFCALFDKWLLKLAGYVTVHLKTRYGIAYALLVLGIACVFFVPLAIDMTMFTNLIIIATCVIATACGFIAGVVRGWLIDKWSGGATIRQLA